MEQYSDEQLLDGILLHSNKVLTYVYKTIYPLIEKTILDSKGTEQDAQDLFQEVIVIVYDQIKFKNLKLTCSLKSYIYVIAKNVWYNELKKREEKIDLETVPDEYLIDEAESAYREYVKNQKLRLFRKHFESMAEDCKTIISLFLNKKRTTEITTILGYSSDRYTATRHFKCKHSLLQKIWQDPNFKQL